jgi:mRNA interferase MazF
MGGVIGPVINRGDVWWADVPGDKVRPVVVLTRQRFTSRLTSLLVAPVTTTVRSIPTEVALGADDGLPRPCAANFDNVFTLQRSRFTARISRLSDDRLREVCRAYRFAAGC